MGYDYGIPDYDDENVLLYANINEKMFSLSREFVCPLPLDKKNDTRIINIDLIVAAAVVVVMVISIWSMAIEK